MIMSKTMARVALGAVMAGGVLAGAPSQSASAASVSTWNRVAKCESGGRWAYNGRYKGGLQFDTRTWRAYGGTRYAKTANKASKAQQIAIANKVLRSQGWRAWPACSKKLGLR